MLGDNTKVIFLAAFAGGRSVEGSKSDSAIIVGDLEVCPGTLGLSTTMCAQQCVEWPEAFENAWVRRQSTLDAVD